MPKPDSGWHRKVDNAATRARVAQYRSPEHKRRRALAKLEVDAGRAHCWRCGTWLHPESAWHLGHDDYDRTLYRGAECAACNLRAAARKGARIANAIRKATRSDSTRLRW